MARHGEVGLRRVLRSSARALPWQRYPKHATHMEVFVAGTTNVVQADQFDVTAWQRWFPLGSMTFDAQTNLAALSRFEGHMEVWAVQGGVIWGNWFIDGSWRNWYPLFWSFEG